MFVVLSMRGILPIFTSHPFQLILMGRVSRDRMITLRGRSTQMHFEPQLDILVAYRFRQHYPLAYKVLRRT